MGFLLPPGDASLRFAARTHRSLRKHPRPERLTHRLPSWGRWRRGPHVGPPPPPPELSVGSLPHPRRVPPQGGSTPPRRRSGPRLPPPSRGPARPLGLYRS